MSNEQETPRHLVVQQDSRSVAERSAASLIARGAVLAVQLRDDVNARGKLSTAETGQTLTIMLPGNVPLEMVQIPPGTFMMGSPEGEADREPREGPAHPVRIARPFWMGKYVVTKAQWKAVVETEPWKSAGLYYRGGTTPQWKTVVGTEPWKGEEYVLETADSPAVYVSWNDCQAFLAVLNAKFGGGFRLPSEAEWEYACRAETTTRFSYGDDPGYSSLGEYAWFGLDWSDTSEAYADGVGQKRANPWGLYDIHGNVEEWCQDCYHDNYTDAPTDGSAWESPGGQHRVLRGGSWYYSSTGCRAACRYHNLPAVRHNAYGVRLVRTQFDGIPDSAEEPEKLAQRRAVEKTVEKRR